MNINKLNSAMTECVTTDLTLRKEKPEQFKKVLYHRLVVCVVVVGGGEQFFLLHSYLYAMGFGGPEYEATYVPDVEDVSFSGSRVTHEVNATVYYDGFIDTDYGGGGLSFVYRNVGFRKTYNVNDIDLANWGF